MRQPDLDNPRTVGGFEVEIITTEAREPYPIIGYIGDTKDPVCWTKEGRWIRGGQSRQDLVKKKRGGWYNVYANDAGLFAAILGVYPTEELAVRGKLDELDGKKYRTTVYIEW